MKHTVIVTTRGHLIELQEAKILRSVKLPSNDVSKVSFSFHLHRHLTDSRFCNFSERHLVAWVRYWALLVTPKLSQLSVWILVSNTTRRHPAFGKKKKKTLIRVLSHILMMSLHFFLSDTNVLAPLVHYYFSIPLIFFLVHQANCSFSPDVSSFTPPAPVFYYGWQISLQFLLNRFNVYWCVWHTVLGIPGHVSIAVC